MPWRWQNVCMELRDTVFTEAITPDQIDAENGVIRNVRVLGSESRNGRTYTEAAMRAAAGLYEGVRINFNHAKVRDAGQERLFEDWGGVLQGVRYVPAERALYGDAHFFTSDQRAPKLVEAARRFSNRFGLSHVAEGVERRIGKRMVVESIKRVASVDFVTDPATNNGLFESEDQDMATKTLREVCETHKDDKQAQHLLEMMDAGTMPADVEVAEVSPEDEMRAAVIAAIVAKLDQADQAQIQGVMEALGMSDSVSGALAGETEAPAEEATEDEEVSESVKQLNRKLALLEAKAILLESGRKATPEQVEAVASATPDKRKALVETWPLIESKQRPGASPPARREQEDASERRWKRAVERVRAAK